MAYLERTYTIHLRRYTIRSPAYKKSKKAITGIVEFVSRHMKQPDESKIKLGRILNMKVWEHGIKNPPTRVKITARKEDSGIVRVELFGSPIEVPKVEEKGKKTDTKELKEQLEAKLEEKKTEEKKELKEEKKAEDKTEEKKSESAEKPVEAKPKKVAKPKKAPAKNSSN